MCLSVIVISKNVKLARPLFLYFLDFNKYPGESIGLKFIPSQSEQFRFIPISVSESMRIIPNQSDLIRLIPKHQSEWTRTNPNPSFQSRSIRAQIDPNRISHQNQSESFRPWIRFGSIQARIDSNWSGLKLGFGLVRVHSDWCFGINRIKSDCFLTAFIMKRDTKCFSDWFGMIRIDSDTDIGMNRNSSDWLEKNFNPILSPGITDEGSDLSRNVWLKST